MYVNIIFGVYLSLWLKMANVKKYKYLYFLMLPSVIIIKWPPTSIHNYKTGQEEIATIFQFNTI